MIPQRIKQAIIQQLEAGIPVISGGGSAVDMADGLDTDPLLVGGKTHNVLGEVLENFSGNGVGSFSHSVDLSSVGFSSEFIVIEINYFRDDNGGANVDLTSAGVSAGEYEYTLEARNLSHTERTNQDEWRLVEGSGGSFFAATGRWHLKPQNGASGGGWPGLFGRGSQNHRGTGATLGKGWANANVDIGSTLTIAGGDGSHDIEYDIIVYKTVGRGPFA